MGLLNQGLIALQICFVFTIFGCGYHLGHGTGNQTGSTLYVDIPMFQNKTNTPKLGSLVTREVKNAMVKTPGIQVVNDAQGADIVVRGHIIRYRVLTTAFDQRATTNEDVELVVTIQAEDSVKKKPLWHETIKASAVFYLGPDLTLNRSAQDRATEEASASLADILIGQLLARHDTQRRHQDKKKDAQE